MLGKEYWADSECALNAAATAVILTFDHVSPPVSPFISFSPLSLRHGVVVVCFEVPGWMLCLNGCSLWSLGSWLGGSPVSALSFVASFTLLHGPFCFVLCCLCFASFSVAILTTTHKMTSCILCLRASSDPTSLCFVVLVLLLFCVFFVLFALFVVWFSMGPLTGLCIGPLPVLCWGYWRLDGIAWQFTIHLSAAIERE